jgi:hypothetical protein
VTAWTNRIIKYGVMPASEFLAHPMNARLHPKHQQDALAGSLDELGWIDDVTITPDGMVTDGHLRVTLALREGDSTPVPFKVVDLDEAEAKKALLIKDPIAALAAVDVQNLDALMRDVDTGSAALMDMLSNMQIAAGLLAPDFEPVGIDEQGRLDEKAKVHCPECGHDFTP